MHPSRGSLFPSCPPAIINVTPVAPAASAPLQAMAPQPSLQVSHCRRRAAVWASLCRSGPSNYYELLGVHPGSSAEEIKRAFFAKSKELHPDRDPGNPALHSRFVELNEAYRVLSREQSRRNYDYRLRSASPPKSPGTTTQHKSARHTYSSWEPPNAQYWAQFHNVRPQGPRSRQQQREHNQRVLGYCLLLMLAGMGLHYVAFRKLEQVHRSFMDEKDRIITAIYNDTRARARANRARIQQERRQRQQPGAPSLPPEGPRMVPRDNSP
ncbi:dnaJ homolog subfamily C member 4 isoform X2 [Nannospalax galili]|uniref:dnaJ homolog subfamily C member 4 isoform X2 n=1 Tax=Nannospalax galili TaxID=1026970 RepID=UPI00111C2B45|nr:dnaJ homolog subfamily C member 4 isoform X2 [Nannospalax galili]